MRRELAGKPSQAHARLWRAMRMQQTGFTPGELIALCAVPRKGVEKFVRGLTRAGYLRAERGGPARRYVLLRDTGPMPPRVSRDGRGVVLDLNETIARDRARRAELVTEIRVLEARLNRFGAYVVKFEAANDGVKPQPTVEDAR